MSISFLTPLFVLGSAKTSTVEEIASPADAMTVTPDAMAVRVKEIMAPPDEMTVRPDAMTGAVQEIVVPVGANAAPVHEMSLRANAKAAPVREMRVGVQEIGLMLQILITDYCRLFLKEGRSGKFHEAADH